MSQRRCDGCPFDVFVGSLARQLAEQLASSSNLIASPRPEVLLSSTEAARRLGRSRRWLDRRRHTLPFVRPRERRGYDVVESLLEDWMRRRQR